MKQQVDNRIYTIEEFIDDLGFFVYTNVGTSMMPLLRQRKDLIEIRKKDRKIKKYDVALYKRKGKYILHRCIKVTPDGYVFAGDHNTFKEYDVTDDMIIGIMSKVIRDGKDIDLSSISYCLYSFIWTNFFPVKVVLLKLRKILRKMCRITPLKLWNYVNWKLVKVLNLYNDYRITGRNLNKRVNYSTETIIVPQLANYLAIQKILSRVNISPEDRIVVLGCGMGRVIAAILLMRCSCQIYGIEGNESLLQFCKEWAKRYGNVHVVCEDVFAVDYNAFSILYLDRSFPGQEAYDYVRLLEQQMQHAITVIHPFDQSSESIFENRPGWTLQHREELLKIHGLQVVGTARRFSIWKYTPNLA